MILFIDTIIGFHRKSNDYSRCHVGAHKKLSPIYCNGEENVPPQMLSILLLPLNRWAHKTAQFFGYDQNGIMKNFEVRVKNVLRAPTYQSLQLNLTIVFFNPLK